MFKLVVLSIAFAVAAAKPSLISPLGLGLGGVGIGGLGLPLGGLGIGHGGLGIAHGGLGVAAPLISPIAAAPIVAAPNYRGPLSLAPGQPANILAADGRPLDTLSVNLDRAAHLTARALDPAGVHLLKKRSIVGAPLLGAGLLGGHLGVPVARVVAPAPVSVSAAGHILPIGTLGLGHGLLGHGLLGHGLLGHI